MLVGTAEIDIVGSYKMNNEAENLILSDNQFISSSNRKVPYAPNTKVLLSQLSSQFEWNESEAHDIMVCESAGNPNSINWKDSHKECVGSYGLFQLSCDKGTPDELLNAERNIEIAYNLWQKNGWQKDWTNCFNKMQ